MSVPWVAHPWPAPNVPGSVFWPSHWLSFPRTSVAQDLMHITGGNPLPGTLHTWTPLAWPPSLEGMRVPIHMHPFLAPNPFGTSPHIDWDLSMLPQTAKRVTGRNCIVDPASAFKDDATWPPTNTMLIASDFILQEGWGPIAIQKTKAIKVLDVLMAVYDYFQEQLSEEDVRHLRRLNPNNYRMLVDAYQQRCRRSLTLRGWERRQGLRRVDLLGDNRKWWGKGLWITYVNGSWYCNLGTVSAPYRYE
ncbi:hypothetical protein NM688_g5025 [Phlebia brevispora]|uniref:Uncharacterized protein n=1 Tax=Phlebia brevispora TaxID=194682 RepID=A0ACC1T0Z9_9APHY|nr:hypothetical protein NM688_g5025 [Phlebia brevispora]